MEIGTAAPTTVNANEIKLESTNIKTLEIIIKKTPEKILSN